jgi:hypothetical protein
MQGAKKPAVHANGTAGSLNAWERSKMRAQAVQAVLRDDFKVKELLEVIKKCGSREGGIKEFADKYSLSSNTVKGYFYNHILTPELDRELPRKKSFRPQKPAAAPKSTEKALWELLKKRVEMPLTKEDIEAVSQETGEHYHTVLSTWGNMAKDITQLKIYDTAASSILAEEKLAPSDFDKAIEATGLDSKKVEGAIFNLLTRPEYQIWREQMCIFKREVRLLSQKSPANPAITTSVKEARNTVSLEHLLEMYQIIEAQAQKIAELQSNLMASRKVGISLLEMIVRKKPAERSLNKRAV